MDIFVNGFVFCEVFKFVDYNNGKFIVIIRWFFLLEEKVLFLEGVIFVLFGE